MKYKFGEYQKEIEDRAFAKLLLDGYSRSSIEMLQETRCLGCGNTREGCQCPFGGSAHPSDSERYSWVAKQIREHSN